MRGGLKASAEPQHAKIVWHEGRRRSLPTLNLRSLLDGRALVLVVVMGGMLTLHGSNDLDAPKIAYFILAAAAVAAAVASAPVWLPRTTVAASRPWLIATAAVVALLLVSLGVSRVERTPFTAWLRDVSSYALFAAAPILALACARKVSQRWLVAVLALSGALASLSFAVEWIGRRRLADLPIDRIALPSETLAAALLALATALALARSPRRLRWAAVGGAVLGLFFITGSRSTLLLLFVPVGAAIFAGRPWRGAAPVLLMEIAMAASVFLVGELGIALANGSTTQVLLLPSSPSAQPGSAAATPAPDRLGQRVTSVTTLVTDPGSDQSFQERLAQTKAAWEAFTGSPLLGVGPGYSFEWKNYANQTVRTPTLDTPLIYLAKFGLLGLVPLALFAGAYLRLALDLWRRRQSARFEYLTLVGFLLVIAVVGLQNLPIEDKGASFALILLIALGVHALAQSDTAAILPTWPRFPARGGMRANVAPPDEG